MSAVFDPEIELVSITVPEAKYREALLALALALLEIPEAETQRSEAA